MTDKEKAQAYDEAFEKAKSWYVDAQIDFKKSLENLFPELQEFEDEKIRKALRTFLTYDIGLDNVIDGIAVKNILSWLKKQKTPIYNPCTDCVNRKGCINCENGELREIEQKSVEWTEEDERVYNEISRYILNKHNANPWWAVWFQTIRKRLKKGE